MPVKDCKTEKLLVDTAKRVFLKEGKLLATTQDIADAAGVNRTLLHYYFRSRDVLFNLVFKEALTELRSRIHDVLAQEIPVKDKVQKLAEAFFEELTKWPYLESFIALQLNQEPQKFEEYFIKIQGGKERLKQFLKDIQVEIDKGNIKPMKPLNFFISLFALMSYPFIARPTMKNLFDLSDAAYDKLITERKTIIMSMLFT